MREALATIYLQWRNDFLTARAFADYHHITDTQAYTLVSLGHRFHEELAQKEKDKAA